jgi:hypothetical protein
MARPARADAAPPAAAPLVLDGQRSATPPRRGWCERSAASLRLVVGTELVGLRCKRRDCPRCWALRSRELARCLVLDARESAPRLCITLTTQTPWEELDPRAYREGSADVWRRLRRRYGPVEYFGVIEFTTGRAARSGGRRRLHGHYLVKPVWEPVDVVEVERVVRETWQARTGAWVVEVAELVSPGAALGYLGLHHRKASQAPPEGWRGMTERASRGYWSRPIAELRRQARQERAAEAHAWRTGLPLEVAALELAARAPARLIEVRRRGELLEPLGEFDVRRTPSVNGRHLSPEGNDRRASTEPALGPAGPPARSGTPTGVPSRRPR